MAMANMEDACFTELCLGVGMAGHYHNNATVNKRKRGDSLDTDSKKTDKPSHMANPANLSLSFSTCSEEDEEEEEEEEEDRVTDDHEAAVDCAVKTPRVRNTNSMSTSNIDCNNLDGGRKKLRLTKNQSTLLEESFSLHRTLTPAQKQTLADQLKLKPRQVEVWFQNRRARSKLKQTEIDFERLKKQCESLSEKNQRLEKELHDLRSVKEERSPPLYAQLPDPNPAALRLCSSCQKIIAAGQRN